MSGSVDISHINWEDCNMSGSVDIRVTSTGRIVTCLGL